MFNSLEIKHLEQLKRLMATAPTEEKARMVLESYTFEQLEKVVNYLGVFVLAGQSEDSYREAILWVTYKGLQPV